jgi:hypothetical protein
VQKPVILSDAYVPGAIDPPSQVVGPVALEAAFITPCFRLDGENSAAAEHWCAHLACDPAPDAAGMVTVTATTTTSSPTSRHRPRCNKRILAPFLDVSLPPYPYMRQSVAAATIEHRPLSPLAILS